MAKKQKSRRVPPKSSKAIRFQISDPLGIRWENEVVTLELDRAGQKLLAAEEGHSWQLRDGSGRGWPAQLEMREGGDPAVHACIDLEAGETLELTLEKPKSPDRTFQVTRDDQEWRIANGLIEVRVPNSQPFQGGQIPPPVLSGRIAGGDWFGQGCITGSTYVGEIHTELLVEGPVFARWTHRVSLGGKTAAHFVCTLYRGADFVWIEDESSTDFAIFFEYVLSGKNAPDRLVSRGAGEHPQRVTEILYARAGKIFQVDFNSGWHQMSQSWCGLFCKDASTMLGVMELRGGSWRKVGRNRIEVHESLSRSVTLRAPLRGGAKQWALMFSPVEKNLVKESPPPMPPRTHLGHTHKKWSELPLQKVLEWHLEWKPPSPRGRLRLFGQDRLAKCRAFWSRYPEIVRVFLEHARPALEADEGKLRSHEGNALVSHFLLAGDSQNLRRAKIGMIQSLRASFSAARDYGYHRLIIFDGRAMKMDLQTFDLLDALGQISDAERQEVCRMTAFLAHCFRDRDYFPFELNMLERADEQSWSPDLWNEIGDCLCPPNFMTEFITSFGLAGCLFPDHPGAALWREDAVRLYTKQLERHYYDGGAYIESINYHNHNQTMTVQMALALQENGVSDFFTHPRFRDQFGYWVAIMTPPVIRNEAGMAMHGPTNSPDAGASRLRMIPSNGNTGHDCSDFPVPAELAMAAAVYQKSDPEYSQRLMRAWREGGRLCLNHLNITSFLLVADPGLPEANALPQESQVIHGLGATLRGDHGHPDEVYLLVKCGWATHHNCKDEGGFCIWAYGAPVSSDQGYHYDELDGKRYGASMTRLHNSVTFDRKTTALLGQETAFPPERFVSTDLADLLVAYLPIESLMETPERSYLELVPCQHIEYRRFLLFVKPHYLVVYDNVAQNVYTTQWYLHCQSKSVAIDGPSIRFEGNWGIDLQAQLFLPAEPSIRPGQFGVQRHVVVEQAGPRDFFAWVAPVKPGMTFEVRQADHPNVLHITGPSYEDTVILAPSALSYRDRGVEFQGRAGVIRRAGRRTHMVLLDGSVLKVR